MDLEDAVKGMMTTRAALRSKQGVSDPNFISENMQRLAQYTAAIDVHLADLEELHEANMTTKFVKYTNGEDAISVSQAETKTRFETGIRKGEIAKLKRYVNSAWQLVGVAQSRHNHLTQEFKQGAKTT
jgi:hypothetical protein